MTAGNGDQREVAATGGFGLSPLGFALLGALFAVSGGWIARLLLGTRGLNVDDAYIHLHIARNWAEGFGPVFNPGERVEASTSPGWLALVALGLKAGLDGPMVVTLLESFSAAAAGAAVALLALPAGAAAAVLAPLTLALLPAFSTWAASGLETPLAVAALAWVVLLGRSAAGALGAAALGLALALLSTVRPEMLALAPVVLGLALVRTPSADRVRFALIAGAGLAIPVSALLLARHAYFGMWVPNTYIAKVAGADFSQRVRGARYAGKFLVVHWPLLAAVALLTAGWRRWLLGPLAVALALIAAVAWAGGDHFYYQRLLVPALGLLCLPLAVALATNTGPRRVAAALLLAVQVPFALFATKDLGALAQEQDSTRVMEDIGLALSRQPKGTLATIGIGAIAWLTRWPVIDMVGLADAHIARSPRFPGAKSGHEHGDAEYVMGRAPDYVLLFTWPTARPVDDIEELQQLSTLRGCCSSAQQLIDHPQFRSRYEPFDLPIGADVHQRVWRRRPPAPTVR